MGRFIYESATGDSYTIDDRTLAHLERAIATKLRRGESFALTLHAGVLASGSGQHVFWIDPNIPLQFAYDGNPTELQLNPAWIDALVSEAYSELGMRIVPEPTATGPAPLVG